MLRKFAYLSGSLLVLVGILGFLPNAHKILGVQPHQITVFHNLVHLITGLGGVYFASRKTSLIKTYFNILGCVYFVLGILGFIFNGNIFNLLIVEPLDNFLHLSIAILGFSVGTIIPRFFSKNVKYQE